MAKRAKRKKPRGTRTKSPARTTSPAQPAPPVQTVKVSTAKGRPMLTWVGKRPLGQLQAFPEQAIERFEARPAPGGVDWSDWPSKYPKGGLLFHGDNKEVLAHLLANGFRGKVQLIYIDPPFDSGADYVRKVSLRGPRGAAKVDGEAYTLGEQIQYEDIWANDNYLQFMYERLLLMHELLAEQGSIIVHLDSGRLHYIKTVMDEVFGAKNFRNEFIVKRRITKNLQEQFERIREYPQAHDTLLWYTSSNESRHRPARTSLARDDEGYWHHFWSGTDRRNLRYPLLGITPETGQWKWKKERAQRAAENYTDYLAHGGGRSLEQYWRDSGEELEFLRLNSETGKVENWFAPSTSRIANTLWLDVHAYENQKDYPTEKHEELLTRAVDAFTEPGHVVLDCFMGSGTSLVAAQSLGRRWIGCDINKGAIQTTAKRLQATMREQAEVPTQQGTLIDTGATNGLEPQPTQFSYSVWRVNNYDLQVQHNEAVALACEHLGVERTRTDRFFDGTRGRSLVKIIPFERPLSPVDVDLVRQELEARPDEDRAITLVCLGIESAAQSRIDEWNRLRRGRDAANRLNVVELRHDPKHGGWLRHQPAEAKVSIARKGTTVIVEVEEFASPSIIERLRQQAGVLNPRIDDFRAMIDSVAIDPAYDGAVFNVVIADVPEKKTDFVLGRYEVHVPRSKTTVAVRITDMLGEEVMVTKML